jgi:hypothetical protein
MKQELFVALPRPTASNTPRVLSCCDIGFSGLKNKRSIPFVHRLVTSLTRNNFLEIRPKGAHFRHNSISLTWFPDRLVIPDNVHQ